MAIPGTYSIIFHVNSYFNHLLGILKEYTTKHCYVQYEHNRFSKLFFCLFKSCTRLYFNSHCNISINSIQNVQLPHQCNIVQHVGLPSTFFSNIITILSNICCASILSSHNGNAWFVLHLHVLGINDPGQKLRVRIREIKWDKINLFTPCMLFNSLPHVPCEFYLIRLCTQYINQGTLTARHKSGDSKVTVSQNNIFLLMSWLI